MFEVYINFKHTTLVTVLTVAAALYYGHQRTGNAQHTPEATLTSSHQPINLDQCNKLS